MNWSVLQTDVLNYLQLQSQDNWRQTFTPLLEGVITEQAERWNTAFGMTFDVQNLYALQWFDDYKLQFSNFVMTTTDNELNTVLQQGMYEGWSIPETQRRIGQVFDQWTTGQMSDDLDWYEDRLPQYRLEMIARTETMRASNAGSYQLFRNWKAPFKGWMATGDDRTRPSHMDAWGAYSRGGRIGPIPMDEPFQVNGRDMMFPGDPAGGTNETVNCRCALLPEFEAGGQRDAVQTQWNTLDPYNNSEAYTQMANYWRDAINSLPPDQIAALKAYTGNDYASINSYLRAGKMGSGERPELESKIRTLQTAINRGAVQNMVAYRGGIPAEVFGFSTYDESVLSMIEGKMMQDLGFTSASVYAKTGLGFGGSSTKAFATVRIPQGTPGVFVESITHWTGEYEFLLNSGTKFRVVEAFMDDTILGYTSIPHLILEVVQ